jgi:cytochrome b
MSHEPHRSTPVWDLSTRFFHWALVALVGTNLFLVEPEGGMATAVHLIAGYGVAGLLLFRLVWGFIGSPRSRFVDFVRPWPVVGDYVARLRRFQPPRSVGHNPLGGWMVVVLLVVLFAMVVTGLFASGRQAAGALAPLVPVAATAIAGDVHEFLSNILIALIVVHLAGVAVDWLLTRENLVKAMIDGRKALPADLAARERPLAGGARAAVVGIVSLLLVAGLIAATDFDSNRGSLRSAAAQSSQSTGDTAEQDAASAAN